MVFGTDTARRLSHVALFMHGFETGGAQRRTVMLAGMLVRLGLRVDLVLVTDRGPLAAEVSPNVALFRVGREAVGFGDGTDKGRELRMAGAIPGLIGYLRTHRPQVFLAAANHAILPALLAHRLSGVAETALALRISNALIGGRKTLRDRLKRWTVTHLYGRATEVVTVADELSREMLTLVPGLRGRITTVPNPVVDETLPQRATEAPPHPWFTDGGAPVVLAVGRMAEQKGFDTLIRAVASLRQTRPVRLLIQGDGKQRPALERLAAELGLGADVVAMPGFTPNPFPNMSVAPAFVLSSRWEGMPGALIEAMALGCPVVSTDCPGGSRDVLNGGALGPLVPVDAVAAMADGIAQVLDHPADRDALKRRAADFSVRAAAIAYRAVLERAWIRSREAAPPLAAPGRSEPPRPAAPSA